MRKNGISGIMRVKNDATFVKGCVRSCIDALDELIIVFNDCQDTSEKEIREIQKQYPDKIKVYEYPYKVYGANISEEEYLMAKKLPKESPHLLCNYYNFALSKATYSYAMKIDADQLYFCDALKEWTDICRKDDKTTWSPCIIVGFVFSLYLSAFRFISLKANRIINILPERIISIFYPSYLYYAKYLLSKGKGCISMSGINTFQENNILYATLGHKNEKINILPPFNGEGDHLIFKVAPTTYYIPFDMPQYNTQRSSSFSLIEDFVHPYKVFYAGFFWLHLSCMRPNTKDTVSNIKKKNDSRFLELKKFIRLDYSDILNLVDAKMFGIYQKILFSFIFKANYKSLRKIFEI